MAALRQDLTYSFRRLSRSPGFVFAVILSIGLGIAANSTIFSMVSRFVFWPAPVGDPGTLMAIHTTHDGDRCCNNFSWPVYTTCATRPNPSPASRPTMSFYPRRSAAMASRSASGAKRQPPTSSMSRRFP